MEPLPANGIDVQAADVAGRADVVLIDVRTAPEVAELRIAGAQHFELDALSERAGEIPRDRPVVFQCATGVRSAMAAQAFRAAGWDAYNLAGGIEAWQAAGLPVER